MWHRQLCRDFPNKLVSFTRNVVSRRVAIWSCLVVILSRLIFETSDPLDSVVALLEGLTDSCQHKHCDTPQHFSDSANKFPKRLYHLWGSTNEVLAVSAGLLLLSLPLPGSRATCSRRQDTASSCPRPCLWAVWPFACCTPATTTCLPCGCSAKGCQGRRPQTAWS